MERLLSEIIRLTSQSLQVAECILEITEEMKEYIQNQNIDSLNKAIGMRQKRIEDVDSTNAAATEKMSELLKRLSVHSLEDIDKEKYPQAESIVDSRAKMKKIFSQAYDLEKANRERAEGLLEEYKDAIKGLHINKKALRTYGNSLTGQSILINKVK